ncbi:hypothetical protein [Sorangium sp. So ce1151]|uniref:hypothetical protein n=1 Tax=Sorangium sp. So ce1151 TaxID=3133332 RepID=UPI003F6233FC
MLAVDTPFTAKACCRVHRSEHGCCRRTLRLVYPPHGESSGWLAFRVADMAFVSRRPSFDALVMLLERQRWCGVAAEQALPAILAESRKRNAGVTNMGVLSTAAPRWGDLSGRRCRPAPDLTTGGAEMCGS